MENKEKILTKKEQEDLLETIGVELERIETYNEMMSELSDHISEFDIHKRIYALIVANSEVIKSINEKLDKVLKDLYKKNDPENKSEED